MQEKKQQQGFSNRREDFWSEVLRMSFKEERGQWTRPWRKDRHEHAETGVGGQWSFQTHGLSWAKWTGDEPGSSLRAGLCSFPCLLLHLRALALYMISNRHRVGWKFNTNETKFRAWLGECPMVWFVKTTGWDQGEDESSWHGEQLRQGIQGWQDEGCGPGGPHASGWWLRTRGREGKRRRVKPGLEMEASNSFMENIRKEKGEKGQSERKGS